MGSHIIDGKFQSDKYPTTPRGKVPLSTGDKAAQTHLWEYAHDHRPIDPEFSEDVQSCLLADGYVPLTHRVSCIDRTHTACGLALQPFPVDRDIVLGVPATCERCEHVVAQIAWSRRDVAARALVGAKQHGTT